MDSRDTTGDGPVRLTGEQVADLLEKVYAANSRMAAEVDLILGSRAAVSQSTVDRFARLVAALEPDLLMAGTSLWMRRRRAASTSASARAAQRWSGGQSA